MGLTGKVVPNRKGYGPITADVHRSPFPLPHQGVSVEDALKALDTLFYSDADPEGIAAILIEPVQGEGGFNVAPAEFLARLRELCDAHGILLIVDEIQSGGGRTGRFFAVEHSGVEPDLVTMAKALGGGLPISAVIGRARIMDQIEPGGFGSTYGGSPVACAAALAVLDVIAKENLIERAVQLGARMRQRFDAWAEGGGVRNVRGLGAMLGFDLGSGAAARRVVARALGKGLLALTCGRNSETIRVLVPLTIEEPLLDEGLGILEQSLREESRA
jgi:4-aminobutyrate aminotransferase/(S)-3-amino-2-methylpropionate transaminase